MGYNPEYVNQIDAEIERKKREAVVNALCSDSEDVESTLNRLSKYGNPTLMRTTRGWWCYIDIHVTAVGARFEIKSESDHKFPKHAALECESRMMTALRAIGAAG